MSNSSPTRAVALRLTRTDACGVPVAEATANSRITRADFVTVGLANDVITSTDIQVTGASGAVCVYSKGTPSLVGADITLQLCSFDLAVLEMTLGAATLTDYAAPVEDVGAVISASGTFNPNTVMVEWWSLNNNNDACVTGGANPVRPYVHSVLPRVNRWVLSGNLDFGDQATTMTLAGYAEPTSGFDASRAEDAWTAADIAAVNNNGLYAFRETPLLPTTISANGYDA